jgi:hypothetical protein
VLFAGYWWLLLAAHPPASAVSLLVSEGVALREKVWTRWRAALIDVHTNSSGCCCRISDPRAQPDNRARTVST